MAVVGYTNSGKTTLMRKLTKATIEGKDELFATLDSCVRPLDPHTRPRILLTDTVGFIRNLPHSLVDSFKSTLEEIRDADLLLHIVDLSSSNYDLQIKTTLDVLNEIGAGDIQNIMVFNKLDKIDDEFLPRILRKRYPGSIVVSALNPSDIISLRDIVFSFFTKNFKNVLLQLDSEDTVTISYLYRNCVILGVEYLEQGTMLIDLRAPDSIINRVNQFIVERDKYDTKDR